MGVLNRIALAYFFAGLLFCFFKPRALVAICVGILVGYWALMTFIPVRDIQLTKTNLAGSPRRRATRKTAALFKEAGNPSAVKDSPAWAAAEKMFYATTNRVTGKFDKGLNLANHFDFQYLPGAQVRHVLRPGRYPQHDPRGGDLPAGGVCRLALRQPSAPDKQKVVWLICVGVAAAALGWLWNFQFPVIKKIWTSSYVLVAGGYSAILLGVFYLIVDVWKARAWCQPFVWIGMNSITIYLASNILGGFRRSPRAWSGGDIKIFFDEHVAKGFGDMVISIVGLLLAFWLVHFLYKRKIFLRI